MSASGEPITITSEGCAGAARFLWSDVRAVAVANRPSTDQDVLSLRFALRDGRSVEITEEMPGFTQLVQVLPEVLAGFPDQNEWLYDATEADPGSETLLYERGG